MRVAGVGFVHEKHERYEKVGWVEAIAETHHLRIHDGFRYRSTHPTALPRFLFIIGWVLGLNIIYHCAFYL